MTAASGGVPALSQAYTRVFEGPVGVWVGFHDIVEMDPGIAVVRGLA